MADNTAQLKNTSSYSTLLRAVDFAAAPPLLHALRLSHTGRVLEEGLNEGVAELAGFTLGLPQRGLRFIKEQITGKRDATPLENQSFSQEWFTKKMEEGRESTLALLGRSKEEITTPTDKIVHGVGKLAPMVGSFFIPGLQEVSAVKIPKLVTSLGSQMAVTEIGMDVIDFTENKLQIWAGNPAKTQIAKTGTSAEFEKAVFNQPSKDNMTVAITIRNPELSKGLEH